MKFGAPEFIKWLLLILPLAGIFILLHRRRTARLAQMVAASLWNTAVPGYRSKIPARRTALRTAALFCILLALTRPQWGSHWEEVRQRGLDVIVVLDTSRSMLAEDIKPNRLRQAQWAVRDFVRQLKGDRIGLVAFAGSSFLQCPVTVDYAAFTMMLDDLYAGIIPRGGTAIEQALQTAAESFDAQAGTDRVIILITDGEDHEGDPLRMAEKLKKDGIRVFTIGVGTPDGDLIPDRNGYVKDRQGQVVKSALHETALEKLASETGGFYVRSAPGDFGLDRIYKLGIAGLQRSEQETRLARVFEERFGWFAAAALLFLLAEGILRPAVLVLLLAGFTAPGARAAGWEKAYRKGDYTNALQQLEKTIQQFPDVGAYNRGNIFYRQKNYPEAEAAYAEAAAQTTDKKLQLKALYNRGTALLAETPQQTNSVADTAMRAAALFEQALLLDPSDPVVRQNHERALNLAIRSHIRTAADLIRQAEALLQEFKAKASRENCEKALKELAPVFDDLAPANPEASGLKQRAENVIRQLDQAVADTRSDLETAKKAIDRFQYKIAADIMLDGKPERKWAFDLDTKLAEEFQQFTENNRKVIEIVYPQNPLKP